MEQKTSHFKQLRVWQRGIDVVDKIYQVTESFPKRERYNLVSQMCRSAVSVPSNIAEGFKRYHNKEFKQFLFIAQGSIAELETQIYIAINLKYISQPVGCDLLQDLEVLAKMLTQLSKKL